MQKQLITLAVLAILVCACSATRELRGAQLDITIGNCRDHSMVGGRRVCTRCHDNHVLVPGGLRCERAIGGCRDYGWVGGQWRCTGCVDRRPLLPGGVTCGSVGGFGH